jgi:hypothetical protein
MKLTLYMSSLFILAFTTVHLLMVTAASPLIKEKEKMSENTVMTIIQSILVDPEFLALNPRKQLHLLIVIYDILENHYKQLHLN